jgi:hypothetical protein
MQLGVAESYRQGVDGPVKVSAVGGFQLKR